MKPKIRCTDPAFKYTTSTNTDIRKTFARIKRQAKAAEEAEAERRANVVVELREKAKP